MIRLYPMPQTGGATSPHLTDAELNAADKEGKTALHHAAEAQAVGMAAEKVAELSLLTLPDAAPAAASASSASSAPSRLLPGCSLWTNRCRVWTGPIDAGSLD